MAYFKRLPKEKAASDVTIEGIVDTANRVDCARAIETAAVVRQIVKEEKGRKSGLRMIGNLQYIPKGGNAIIIGDLHGDESSLVKILKETSFVEKVKKGEKLTLVFLGDYIDRGPNPLETLNIVLELKRSFRDNVVMLRGDHELQPSSPNSPGGQEFLEECTKRYKDFDGNVYRHYLEVLGMLPLAAKSENKILFVHGGVGERTSEADMVHGGEEVERDLVWNDFAEIEGVRDNTNRGIGKLVGPDVLKEVRDRMDCNIVINGHEPVEAGRVERFGSKLATINSNYIVGYLAHKNFAVGYGYASLEEEVDNVSGIFHRI